jgi:uncharacterized protein YkwD
MNQASISSPHQAMADTNSAVVSSQQLSHGFYGYSRSHTRSNRYFQSRSSSEAGLAARVSSKVLTRFVRQVLNLTNRRRQQAGLEPLRLHRKLSRSAQIHSQDMALNDVFSHIGSDGSSLGDRITRVGYRFSSAAENIAVGASTPKQVVNLWMNSPGHRANILNPSINHLGVGYYYLPNDTGNERWHHYWTQNFASPLR